jgi:dihydroorotase
LVPYGATGLETTFAFLYTELVDKGILTISQLVSALSFRPAQMLGRADVAGTLQPGSPADFVLVDPNVIEQVKRDSLISQKNSPLMGMDLKGWPVATYVGGQQVFAKGDPA